jgi:hypothetical protein
MSMNPPTVLLHATFLAALTEPDHPQHDAAVSTYLALLDDFESDTRLLAALSDHLRPFAAVRRTLLAPVTTVHVAGQHRSAARAMTPTVTDDPDLALTLVIIRREKLAAVAAFDPRFDQFEVEVMPPVVSAG